MGRTSCHPNRLTHRRHSGARRNPVRSTRHLRDPSDPSVTDRTVPHAPSTPSTGFRPSPEWHRGYLRIPS